MDGQRYYTPWFWPLMPWQCALDERVDVRLEQSQRSCQGGGDCHLASRFDAAPILADC